MSYEDPIETRGDFAVGRVRIIDAAPSEQPRGGQRYVQTCRAMKDYYAAWGSRMAHAEALVREQRFIPFHRRLGR